MNGPVRHQITGFAAEVLGATLDDLARVTAERDALRERIAAYRDAWAVLDAGTETVSVKQAQVDHMHRSRAALFAALAEHAAADGGSGGPLATGGSGG